MTEEERIQDLRNRFAALYDIDASAYILNADKWLEDLMNIDSSQAELDMASLESEDAAHQASIDAIQYISDRAEAYDPIGDQLDNMIKSLKFLKDNGTNVGPDGDSLIASSDAVKASYPKPV